MTILRTLLVIAVLFQSPITKGSECDANWHQFRGPTGNGSSAHAQPPIHWSAESYRWKAEMAGRGNSSPIVWKDEIFLLTAVKTDRQMADDDPRQFETRADPRNENQKDRRDPSAPTHYHDFFVVCVSRENGKQIWKTKVTSAVPHERGHSTNTLASASPVTDGKHVWASFNSFGLFCLDMNGNVVWERQFGRMQTAAQFGDGASPSLHENTLVLNWDHQGQSFIVALDATNGNTKWKKDRDEATTWSTPSIVKHRDRVQIITNGRTRVRSYDFANGDLIWQCGGQTENPIATPIAVDDLVVCMTGFRGNAAMGISLDSSGDITESDEIVWKRDDIGTYVPTGVFCNGHIYSTQGSNPILTSIKAKTGETVIAPTRLSGIQTLYASLVSANDHIYVTGRNGKTLVLRHRDQFDVVATNDLGDSVDATPALIDNQIIIRSHNDLYCFDSKERMYLP